MASLNYSSRTRVPEAGSSYSAYFVMLAVTAVLAHAILQYIRYYNLKGPRVWPYIGSIHLLILNSHRLYDWITDLLQEHGETYKFLVPILPTVSAIITCNTVCVEHILKTRFSNYPKGPKFSYPFHELLGGGIFNSDSDSWRIQRKTASLEFSTKALRDLMVTSVRDSVQKRLLPIVDDASQEDKIIDLQDVFLRYTFDNICIVAFGVDPGCLSPGLPHIPFARSFDIVTEATCQRFIQPEWLWRSKRALGLGIEGKLKSALVVVDDFARHVIATRRKQLGLILPEDEQPTKDVTHNKSRQVDPDLDLHRIAPKGLQNYGPNNLPEVTNCERGAPINKDIAFVDLLSRFMQLKDIDGKPYSDSFLRDVATNFIIAGRDTSAVALTWFFWLLSENPHVEDKILDELSEIRHSRAKQGSLTAETAFNGIGQDIASKMATEPFTFDEIRRMQYLHAALSEALRLYPSVPLDTKYAADDDILPDGTMVQRGARVVYAIYSMGRMPSIWGPDCLEFKPERWLRNGIFVPESPFKFAAFNGGARLCLGKDMGYLQMKAVASAILSNFKVQVVSGQRIEYRVSLTLFMKQGLKVRFRRRSLEELRKLPGC